MQLVSPQTFGNPSAQASAPLGGRRYPDFIIGGAPKSGTTSLHFILDQHEHIALPHDEVHFFDADDPVTHPDFFGFHKGSLKWWDTRSSNDAYLDWYADRFPQVSSDVLIGEDSTTYLMSELAAPRIHALLPEARLIFMLRHPVDRAYSQYWHLIKTSRISETFEQAILRRSHVLLGSSYYRGLKHFVDLFGPERVKVLIFEDFRADIQGTVNSVTGFLDVKPMQIDPSKTWFNRTKYPASLTLQMAANRLGMHLVKARYREHMGGNVSIARQVQKKLHYWWFEHLNPRLMTADRPPNMRPETRDYLSHHLSARNAGLSEFLDRDLAEIWPGIRC